MRYSAGDSKSPAEFVYYHSFVTRDKREHYIEASNLALLLFPLLRGNVDRQRGKAWYCRL